MPVSFPNFNAEGDLPVGVYRASLQEVVQHFGTSTAKRLQVARRLERIYSIASATGKIAHFIIFGSFLADKPDPDDVDIFIIMENDFEANTLAGEARILFDHLRCQAHFGASVFWVRRMAALGGEQSAIEDWQIKRDGNKRGIVEIIS
jgi:predicted nucleotidyltransferase